MAADAAVRRLQVNAGCQDRLVEFASASRHLSAGILPTRNSEEPATRYQGTITGGLLNADSVGFLYNSVLHETSVFVNTTGAAESLTGPSAISPMLELAGYGSLTAANFNLAHA